MLWRKLSVERYQSLYEEQKSKRWKKVQKRYQSLVKKEKEKKLQYYRNKKHNKNLSQEQSWV